MYSPKIVTHKALMMLLRQLGIPDDDIVRITFTLGDLEVWRLARDEEGKIKVTTDRKGKNPMPAYRVEHHTYG